MVFALQFARFGVVGAVNTLLTLGVILVLGTALRVDYRAANAAGYAAGLACSFFLNRQWTFKSRGAVPGQAVRFLVVFAACYALQLLVLMLLVDGGGWNHTVAQLLAMAVYTGAGFLLGRFFVFRERT